MGAVLALPAVIALRGCTFVTGMAGYQRFRAGQQYVLTRHSLCATPNAGGHQVRRECTRQRKHCPPFFHDVIGTVTLAVVARASRIA